MALGRKEDRVRNRPETEAKIYLSKAYIWYLISSGLLPEHPKIVPLVGYQVFNTGPIGIISYSNSDLAKVFFFSSKNSMMQFKERNRNTLTKEFPGIYVG